MAGTVDLVQRCCSGIGIRNNTLRLDPCLSEELAAARSRIQFHGHSLSLSITGKKLTVSVDKDWSSPTKIGFGRKTYTFKGGETKEFDL